MGDVPHEGIVCEESAIATDCRGTLQIETQDVRLKRRRKTNVLVVSVSSTELYLASGDWETVAVKLELKDSELAHGAIDTG
jgi:hypothetical protein